MGLSCGRVAGGVVGVSSLFSGWLVLEREEGGALDCQEELLEFRRWLSFRSIKVGIEKVVGTGSRIVGLLFY